MTYDYADEKDNQSSKAIRKKEHIDHRLGIEVELSFTVAAFDQHQFQCGFAQALKCHRPTSFFALVQTGTGGTSVSGDTFPAITVNVRWCIDDSQTFDIVR